MTRPLTARGPASAPSGRPDQACGAINGWVSGETHDRIPVILKTCTPEMVLVIANAVYFKGVWQSPFSSAMTVDRDFHPIRGAATRVPTMTQAWTVPYAHIDGVQVVSLPYRGALSMLVALPDDPKSLSVVEHELATRHPAWVAALATRTEYVDLRLPRWTARIDYELVPALASLGMRLAFGGSADFSRLSPAQLSITNVAHEALVAVDEKGTVAAASTAVAVAEIGLVETMTKPVPVHADHPFLYFVEDRSTGAVLFAGRVAELR